MKSIIVILKNGKNLLPYFILVAIYFFFINLEASKQNNEKFFIEKLENSPKDKSSFNDKNIRLSIPVIPYNK